jgi:hypothetical protein
MVVQLLLQRFDHITQLVGAKVQRHGPLLVRTFHILQPTNMALKTLHGSLLVWYGMLWYGMVWYVSVDMT